MGSSYHCCYQLFCIFLNFAAVVGTILVIVTSLGIQYGFHSPIPDLLNNGTAEVDSAFPTPISPSSWIYVTWLVVYFWMFLWSFHAVVSTCRKQAGVPVYVSPTLVNAPVCLLSVAACGMTVAWFCVYDHEYITTACLLGLCITCFSWTAYTLSLYTLHVGLPRLEKTERLREAWLHRLLVQNGLALLGMWSFFVSILNLCTALIHNEDLKMDKEIAAVISLSVVAFFMVLYIILDVSVLDRFTRYTFLHYLVPIVVLCNCIFREDAWHSDSVIFILLATLVAFSFLATMLKAACVSCRIMTSADPPRRDELVIDESPQSNYYLSSASSVGNLQEGHYLLRK